MSSLLLELPKEVMASLNVMASLKALEFKPDKDKAWNNRGAVLSDLGRYEDHDAWYNRGIALANLKRLEEAIASFDKALQIKPDDYEAWNNRGVLLDDLERLEEAIASFDKAIQIKLGSPEVSWYNRGITLIKLKRLEEAIASFDEALKFKPDFYQAWYYRGVLLVNLRQLEEALTSFNKAIGIKADFYEAWYNRGVLLVDLRQLEEAIASFDKVLEIKRDDHDAWYNRGVALYDLERLDEAIASFDEVLEIKRDDHKAWYNRGVALGKLGRSDEAIANFDKAIQSKRDDHEAWYNRGVALCDLGRLDEAIASYDKALESKPDYTDAFYNKACCYALQGNVEQALENLQQAINLNPDKYREEAKTDSDFHSIRDSERFQALIQEESDWEEGEIDVEKDIVVPMQPLSQRPVKINVKHLDIAKLKEGESKIFHDVSWEDFENILAELGDNRSSRVAYNQGTLEITMPSQKHEYYKEIIRDLIKYLAEEFDFDCESLGSTTWKRKDLLKGAEPDNCFYIQNEPAIREVKPNIDLSKDPPPDLILEVDYTSPSLNRQPIYAGLGVPEIWIYNMKVLRIYQLESGKYKETDTSLAFGTFPVKEIPSFIKKNIKASPREFRQSFRAWVRQYLKESLH